MKRIIILFFVLTLLLACVPTPEEEFVVNKGDSTVEDKINVTPKPAEDAAGLLPNTHTAENPVQASENESEAPLQAQRFPDRWDEEATKIDEHVTISVHANVIQKEDGLYPVYRTKDAPLTDAEVQALAAKLLDKPKEAYTSEMTKEDYKKQLQDYLDTVAEQQAWVDAGRPDWGDRDETVFTPEQIEAETNRYMELIKNAPDTLETRPVSDYSGLHFNTETVYTLESGEKAYVTFYKWGFQVYKGCSYYGHIYQEAMYRLDKDEGEANVKFWHDVTMEREAAEAILNTELERLSLTEYRVSRAEKACLLERSVNDRMKYKSSGWMFTLIRNPAGYPVSDLPWEPSQYLKYGNDDSFVANEPVLEEHIVIFIDENGLQSFSFYNRREVTGLPNANVELLPFEEVQRIAKNTLAMCMPHDIIGERSVNAEVYKALLTTYTLRVKDSDEYYEMPCWALFFDGLWGDREFLLRARESYFEQHDVLLLNAVDGSIIHPDYGY